MGGYYLYDYYSKVEIKLQDNCCPEAMTKSNIEELIPKALRAKYSVPTVALGKFNEILDLKQPNYDQEYISRKFKALPLAFCHAVLLNVVILVQIAVVSIVDLFVRTFLLPLSLPAPYSTAYDNFMTNLLQNPIQILRNGDIKGFMSWLARAAAVLVILKIALPLYPILQAGFIILLSIMAAYTFATGEVAEAIGSNLGIGLGYLLLFISKDDRPAMRFIHSLSLERYFHFSPTDFFLEKIKTKKINLIRKINLRAGGMMGSEYHLIFKNCVQVPQRDRVVYVNAVARLFTRAKVKEGHTYEKVFSILIKESMDSLNELETNIIKSIPFIDAKNLNSTELIKEKKEKAAKNVKELKETYVTELLRLWELEQTNRLNTLQLNQNEDNQEQECCRHAIWLMASIPYIEEQQLQIKLWESMIKYLGLATVRDFVGSEEEKFHSWHNKMIESLSGVFKGLKNDLEISKKQKNEKKISEEELKIHKIFKQAVEEQLKGLCKFLIDNPHLSKDFQVQYPSNMDALGTMKVPEEKAENFLNLAVLMEISYQTGQWSLYAKDLIQKNLIGDIDNLNLAISPFNTLLKEKIPKNVKNQIVGAMFLNQFRKENVLYPREIPISLNNAIKKAKKPKPFRDEIGVRPRSKVEEEKIN